MTDQIRRETAAIATAVRLGRDPTDARRDLAAAKLERYVRVLVASAPPLTEAQCSKIVALLRPQADVEDDAS
jgi:hypothetical protein